jgi:hypothetical protein
MTDKTAFSVIADAVDATFMQRGFRANRHAAAILEALNDAGFAIVPKEPTTAMICGALEASLEIMAENGVNALSPFGDYPPPGEVTKRCYRAMIKSVA